MMLCNCRNMCCIASCSLHSKSAAHGEVGTDECILLFWENRSGVFAFLPFPSPPVTCPPLQISGSFLCLPWDIWLSGLPACEKPLICTALTLFLARTGKLVSFFAK